MKERPFQQAALGRQQSVLEHREKKGAYLSIYIHEYVHACMHTYVHTYMQIHEYIHACMHACIQTYMHTCKYMNTYMHACMHAYIRTCMHAYNLLIWQKRPISAKRDLYVHAYMQIEKERPFQQAALGRRQPPLQLGLS